MFDSRTDALTHRDDVAAELGSSPADVYLVRPDIDAATVRIADADPDAVANALNAAGFTVRDAGDAGDDWHELQVKP